MPKPPAEAFAPLTRLPLPSRRAAALAFLVCLILGALPAASWSTPAPAALTRVIDHLPAPGQQVDISALGITIGSMEHPPPPIAGGYNFRTPANIDRDSTTSPPYRGRFPGLYLNQPLETEPASVGALFISDQPEEIKDDRLREDGSRGATGVYARAAVPTARSVRILVDHTNGTARRLRLGLGFIPACGGTLATTSQGVAVNLDSVRAGRVAFERSRAVLPIPRREVSANGVTWLLDLTLPPKETAVAHLVVSSTVAGELVVCVAETDGSLPARKAEIDCLPTLHSIVWREEARRLEKFLDPRTQPARFTRILDSFQHARGLFPSPDRVARVTYDAPGWSDADEPLRVYSLFESIPGFDPTPGTRDPRNPNATIATVDNRGKYGGVEELRVNLRRLPPGCRRMALLVLNPNGTFGGRHYVTNGRTDQRETWFLQGGASQRAGGASPVGDVQPLLEKGRAALLWRGEVRAGDVIRMWTEPMANTSVYLWYLLVPLPGSPDGR